jgi:glycosyltransferase involved in cell wall biosynthesis
MNSTLISFVIPCYRSEKTISKVINEIIETVGICAEYDYEIIAVNDCSPDNVLELLKSHAERDSRIKVLSFSKNMGKHAAVLAGYAVSSGEYVVDLDDDFQSPVHELWRLLEIVASDQCDYATARYRTKRQSFSKRLGSNINLLMSSIMLDKPANLRFENFSVMKRFVAQEVIKYHHPFPYLEGLVLRVTRRIGTVEMDQRERGDDSGTGFTLSKSLSLWLNGLTAFSVKPLRVASLLGAVVAGCGFAFAAYLVIQRLLRPEIVAGYSSIMATLLITSGIIMLLLGLIGEYLGRVYICINAAPQYVVRDSYNVTAGESTEKTK